MRNKHSISANKTKQTTKAKTNERIQKWGRKQGNVKGKNENHVDDGDICLVMIVDNDDDDDDGTYIILHLHLYVHSIQDTSS